MATCGTRRVLPYPPNDVRLNDMSPEQTRIEPGLDWLDRASCLYLLLPVLLFCLWFATPFAVLLVSLVGYGTYRALAGAERQSSGMRWTVLAAICALSLTWTAIAGIGHYLSATSDWIVRDAVLRDLTVAGWPPSYTGPDGAPLNLRTAVAYYLPSASVGHLFGLPAANTSLYLWTALGFALFLASACRLFGTGTQRAACVLILLLFGGMDLLGYLIKTRQLPMLSVNLEWWQSIIQYPSNAYLIAWVPNHALPAWLGTVLVLRHWRSPSLAWITPLLSTALPLWSPFAAIGLFPFLLFALDWRRDLRILFSPHTCWPFLLPALAISGYAGMDAGSILHGWLVLHFVSVGEYLSFYAIFCLLEFGLLALLLSRLAPLSTPQRIAVVVLCLLPLYVYGPYNDLAMRASIPALTVLALATVRPLTVPQRSVWQFLLLLVMAVVMLGAMQHPVNGIIGKRWKPMDHAIPDAIMVEHDWSTNQFPPHYFAHPDRKGTNRFLRRPGQGNAVPTNLDASDGNG